PADRREHRPERRDHRRRLRPGPLVHGAAGARVRHGRPDRRVGRRRPSRPRGPEGGSVMASYTAPAGVAKPPLGERAFDVFSRRLSERIVFLGTEIDAGVATVVMAPLLHLESDAPDQEIGLYINSPGGSATALMAIYDTMQFVRC